jgi:hypothetical protein
LAGGSADADRPTRDAATARIAGPDRRMVVAVVWGRWVGVSGKR